MIIEQASEVLKIEAESILNLIDKIDHNFTDMVETIYKAKGRVIFSGIGKSGLIGRKIAATLNSTGTNSFFLHPVEAMHGDLGMVCKDDIFIALSNSGETEELNLLMPNIQSLGCTIIAFTGKPASTLGSFSNFVIDVSVDKEACPLGLAPTSSTTALLAMGDALAVVLINIKKFQTNDFKKFHPGGALGQILSSKVEDIMITGDAIPAISENTTIQDAVIKMDDFRLGVVFILSPEGKIAGILTDGDVRHLIAKNMFNNEKNISEVMTHNPKRLIIGSQVFDALNTMENHQITVLPVTTIGGKVAGALHLHDILGKGQFKFSGK